MMVTLEDAPERLEELCASAVAGQDVIILRNGLPFIRVESLSDYSTFQPTNESQPDSL